MAQKAEMADGRFHPTVYKIIAGLAAWFVISAWIFAGDGETDFLLVVVSGLVAVMTGIPSLLAFVRRAQQRRLQAAAREESKSTPGFQDWLLHDVEIATGPIGGFIAATETILPVAAVAFGMTLFGLVLHFVAH